MNPPLSGPKPDADFVVLLGEVIAVSTARTVHACKTSLDFVIKVAKCDFPHLNWVEYIAWNQCKDNDKLSPLLAACPALSYSGKYLLMERLSAVPEAQRQQITAPLWVTDLKAENFGVDDDGRIKMLDYGQLSLAVCLQGLALRPIT